MNVIKKNSAGFTLIELLVTIAIFGLITSITTASLNTSRYIAHDTQRITQLNQLSKALEMYYLDNGLYPEIKCDSRPLIGWGDGVPSTGTEAQVRGNNGQVCWQPGGAFYQALVPKYISALPLDPTNAGREGMICGGCAHYLYDGWGYGGGQRLYGKGYLLSTYLATDHPQKSFSHYDYIPIELGGSPIYAIGKNCNVVYEDYCELWPGL